MTTKAELAALAASVNAEALAEAAGISTKTVYRIRQQHANPSLGTVEKVQQAVAIIKARAPADPQPAGQGA